MTETILTCPNCGFAIPLTATQVRSSMPEIPALELEAAGLLEGDEQ